MPSGGVNGDTHLVGYETNGGSGGPTAIEEGAAAPDDGQIIVDKAFAKKAGLDVGDSVGFRGDELAVAAISDKGDFIFSSNVVRFARYAASCWRWPIYERSSWSQ